MRCLHFSETIELPGSLSVTPMEVCKELTLLQISIKLCRFFSKFLNETWKLLSLKYLNDLGKANAPSNWLWIKCYDKHLWGIFFFKRKIDDQLLNGKSWLSQTSFDAKFYNGRRRYYQFQSITALFLNWQHHAHGWKPCSPSGLYNKSQDVVLLGQLSRNAMNYRSKRALCILE